MSKDQILEAISNLTVIELKELLDAFEEKFGVSAAGRGRGRQGQARRGRRQRRRQVTSTGIAPVTSTARGPGRCPGPRRVPSLDRSVLDIVGARSYGLSN